MLSANDLSLIAALHGGFPLSDRPYAEMAARLGCSEDALIEQLRHLLAHGNLTRFGPLFQIERAGGRFVLAAMAVPEPEFERVAQLLWDIPQVAHNYRRESFLHPDSGANALNMWFVIAVGSPDEVPQVVAHIEQASGLTVFQFPKEREYFVELRLPLMEMGHDRAG